MIKLNEPVTLRAHRLVEAEYAEMVQEGQLGGVTRQWRDIMELDPSVFPHVLIIRTGGGDIGASLRAEILEDAPFYLYVYVLVPTGELHDDVREVMYKAVLDRLYSDTMRARMNADNEEARLAGLTNRIVDVKHTQPRDMMDDGESDTEARSWCRVLCTARVSYQRGQL